MRLPDEQGVGAQQAPVLPEVLGQQPLGCAGWGQQSVATSALLAGGPGGTGQHRMIEARCCGQAIRLPSSPRVAPAAAPGNATTHAVAVAASRSVSETRQRRNADPDGRVWTVTA